MQVWTCIIREESMIAKDLGVNFVEMTIEVLIRIDAFSKRESINSWEKGKENNTVKSWHWGTEEELTRAVTKETSSKKSVR